MIEFAAVIIAIPLSVLLWSLVADIWMGKWPK